MVYSLVMLGVVLVLIKGYFRLKLVPIIVCGFVPWIVLLVDLCTPHQVPLLWTLVMWVELLVFTRRSFAIVGVISLVLAAGSSVSMVFVAAVVLTGSLCPTGWKMKDYKNLLFGWALMVCLGYLIVYSVSDMSWIWMFSLVHLVMQIGIQYKHINKLIAVYTSWLEEWKS